MKVRSLGAAASAGVMMAAIIPGVAQAADPVPGYPVVTPITCIAAAVSRASKIQVNIDPDLAGEGYYTFRIDKRTKGNGSRPEDLPHPGRC